MNLLNVAIVDDEIDNVEKISNYLKRGQLGVNVSGAYTNPLVALECMNRSMPDVVLLDIEMPGMNGFELLSKLKSTDLEVIFVTGHDHYAINAIKCAAIDYLLKPFDESELNNAIEKVKYKLKNGGIRNDRFKKIESTREPENKMIIPGTNAYVSITHQNLLYLKAIRGGYTMMYMIDGTKSLATNPLLHYEKLLSDVGFFRSHKSHLINMRHVSYFEPNLLWTRMKDGEELTLATRRKTKFLRMWKAKQSDPHIWDKNISI
ncbi:MAG: response regulator [Bacteroidetes bacterium]|nr:response regulator [Bacteroidota bacterium]